MESYKPYKQIEHVVFGFEVMVLYFLQCLSDYNSRLLIDNIVMLAGHKLKSFLQSLSIVTNYIDSWKMKYFSKISSILELHSAVIV